MRSNWHLTGTFMLKELNHLTLDVSSVDQSFNFYRHILGFKPVAKWDTGAYLKLNTLWLCLSQDQVCEYNDYTHYAFSIDHELIDEFINKIRNEKIPEWKDNTSEGKSIYFLDPDGHKLEAHVGNLATRIRECKKRPYSNMVFFD